MKYIDNSCRVDRTTAPNLDAILGAAFPVLDHGFVRVVDYMGNDDSIVEAARVSYGKGTRATSDNQGLINYLMRHWHSTPFEMCEIKLHVKLPVFVARQWIRHRTASVNEYSARYSILDNEFYIPEPEHMAVQSTTNNQGRGAVLEGQQAQDVLDMIKGHSQDSYGIYDAMQDPEGDIGLARELARMALPVNVYTQWYWKTNLHNLFNFLRLRMDSHAQYEIRAYADIIASMTKDWVPQATSAFENYRLNAMNFSKQELIYLSQMIDGYEANEISHKMSLGEFKEFNQKLLKIEKLS